MPLLDIDDRLARLAEAATRNTRRPGTIRRPHDRRVAVGSGPAVAVAADRALELTGSLLEAMAAGDDRVLRSTCSPSVHARTPTSDTTDIAGLVGAVCVGRPAFTDIAVTIETIVVADHSIAAEWRLQATHTGPLPVDWATIEATGQRISLDGALMGHVSTDEAAEGSPQVVFDDVHVFYDTTSLLVQLALT